jgi:hypothetical protein
MKLKATYKVYFDVHPGDLQIVSLGIIPEVNVDLKSRHYFKIDTSSWCFK